MFDNTIQLNIGSEADPLLTPFVRINQDGYSSEYRHKNGEVTYTFRIRHTTEKNKSSGQPMQRHNVVLTAVENPSTIYPAGRTLEAYTVIRAPQSAADVEVIGLVTATCRFTLDQASRLLNGEP